MRSRFVRTFAVVASLLMLAVAVQSFVTDAAARSNDRNSLVGTWRLQISPRNCQTGEPLPQFQGLVSFAQGGTLTDLLNSQTFQPGQRSPGLGVWGHTHRNNYRSVSDAFIFFDSSPTPGLKRGTQRLTWDIEVHGDDLTIESTGQFLDASGNLVVATCASFTGTRMEEPDED